MWRKNTLDEWTDRHKVKNITPPTMIAMGQLNELFHLPNNTVTSFSPITNCRDISYENIYIVPMSTVTMGGAGEVLLHNSLHRCGDTRAISSSFAAAVNIAFFPREAGVPRAPRAIG